MVRTYRSTDVLEPEFAAIVLKIMAAMTTWCSKNWPGYRPAISESYRTVGRQQELYAQGRTAPGDIVTHKNGTTNRSNHQSGLAVDICGLTPKGNLTWDCPDGFWKALGNWARYYGLDWGGDWKSLRDLPHLEAPTKKVAWYKRAMAWLKTKGLK